MATKGSVKRYITARHAAKRLATKFVVRGSGVLVGLVLLLGFSNTAKAAGVSIDAANFSDAIFRSVIAGSDYDRDQNGVLDANEISLVQNIYCEGLGIQSLQGVEHFTALQGLWCKDNQIASMDLRELAAQVLYELAGKPSTAGLKSRFTDVKKGAWYENALLWGEKNSICIGSPDISSDTFGVGEWITRQDLILMLMRYCEFKNYKRAIDFGRSDDFSDYYEVDNYAWEAICWAATWNITDFQGDPNASKQQRKINPHGMATRADLTEMLGRIAQVNQASKPNVTAILQKYAPQSVFERLMKTPGMVR
ncbi:MAG: hypothetical protein K6F31_02120 [Acetatifactor sp.]|nr:hypothetical protein [Acetatifactor sp.]